MVKLGCRACSSLPATVYSVTASNFRTDVVKRGYIALGDHTNQSAPRPWCAPLSACRGVDMIKLGYIARVLPKDNKNHVILGTQAVKPKDFAAQVRAQRGGVEINLVCVLEF